MPVIIPGSPIPVIATGPSRDVQAVYDRRAADAIRAYVADPSPATEADLRDAAAKCNDGARWQVWSKLTARAFNDWQAIEADKGKTARDAAASEDAFSTLERQLTAAIRDLNVQLNEARAKNDAIQSARLDLERRAIGLQAALGQGAAAQSAPGHVLPEPARLALVALIDHAAKEGR